MKNHETTREYTIKILAAIEEGTLDKDSVILACLNFMSEHEVRLMADMEMFFEDNPEGDDEEDDQEVIFEEMVAEDAVFNVEELQQLKKDVNHVWSQIGSDFMAIYEEIDNELAVELCVSSGRLEEFGCEESQQLMIYALSQKRFDSAVIEIASVTKLV